MSMMKTMKTRQSVVINLPAEEIFAYMSDLENLVDWSGSTIAVRKISPGALHIGATLRSTMRFLGRWMDITFEIVEYEPGRCLTIKSLSGATPCLFCYQFEPTGDRAFATLRMTEVALRMTGSRACRLACGECKSAYLFLGEGFAFCPP